MTDFNVPQSDAPQSAGGVAVPNDVEVQAHSALLDDEHDDEIVPDPPIPSQFGTQLDRSLREKLHQRLLDASGQLGSVYRAMVAHPDAGPTQLLPHTEAANVGAVANRKVVVEAIFAGYEPAGPTVALQAARTVSGLLKAEADDEVKNHLADVLTRLQGRAGNEQAVEAESAELTAQSAELAIALEQASGVYVYTYPALHERGCRGGVLSLAVRVGASVRG